MDNLTKQLLTMIGNGLDSASTAYGLLVDHLTDSEPESSPVATDNPETCLHPNTLTITTMTGERMMCESCGYDFGPRYINGG